MWRAMYDAVPAEAAQGEVEELRHALRLAQDAMRAPIDDWKGELERKALDACRRALAPKAAQDLTADDQAMMQRALHRSAERIAPKAAQDKCDGNHGGPPCADPECWARPAPTTKKETT